MKNAAQLLIWTIAIAVLALPAQAQLCPPGFAHPLQIIDNTTWVFMTQSSQNGAGQASIGKFTAKYTPATPASPFAKGALVISQTLSYNGSITGATGLAGRYSISADCSGGTLVFVLGGQQVQYEFVFMNNFTEMYLIASQQAPAGRYDPGVDVIWGKAKVGPPTGCPVPPLQVVGGPWSYQLYPGYYWWASTSTTIGMFSGTVSPTGQGVLKGFLTRRDFGNGTSAVGGQTSGRYQVNADCSGGSLIITGAGNPVQLDFLFVDALFTQMYLLSTSDNVVRQLYPTNTDTTDSHYPPQIPGYSAPNPLVGEAKRY